MTAESAVQISQANHSKQATHAGRHIRRAILQVKRSPNSGSIQARGFAWTKVSGVRTSRGAVPLARGPARGCESPIIEPYVSNVWLVIVLILPFGSF